MFSYSESPVYSSDKASCGEARGLQITLCLTKQRNLYSSRKVGKSAVSQLHFMCISISLLHPLESKDQLSRSNVDKTLAIA